MNTAEIINDFRRRYEGTFCWLEMENLARESLVKVVRVDDDQHKGGTIHLDSEQFGNLSINMASDGYSLKFKNPPVGVFQFQTDAYYFQRRPQRQWQRGISTSNSYMRNVESSFVGNRARFGAKEIMAAYEHKTFSIDEALFKLGRDARSVALENNYALGLSLTMEEVFLLYHWGHVVATVSPKFGRILSVVAPTYQVDIETMFH